MNTKIIEQIIRLVPAVTAMMVLTIFTVLKVMKDLAPFMTTFLVVMVSVSLLSDDSSFSARAEEHSEDAVDVYVSAGSMSDPHYQFYTDSEGTTEITELDITHTYNFHRLNGATSHPFYISDQGYESESSDKITITGEGSSDSGITGSETFTLAFTDDFTLDDTLSFYCTVHSSMIEEFTLTESADLLSIPATAVSTGFHNTLVSALEHANLVGTLSGEGPYTVFAPTDSAFEEIGFNLSDYNTDEANETLSTILAYHVSLGGVMSSEITDGGEIKTLIQENITFNIYGESVVLNGEAIVTQADVAATNGVIHVIDKVLLPPSLQGQEPIGEICYNMTSHTVDVTKTEETCEDMWIPSVDIPTTAAATTIHTSLVAALEKANLIVALEANGPFTVFAPTDDAFMAAGIDLDDFETAEQIATLADVLTYHVVLGKVMSTDLSDGMTAVALNGDNLTVSISGTDVSINDAKVILANVPVSNGVIHVIDKVLIPPVDDTTEEGTTEEEETLEEKPMCDHVVGLDSTGYAFSPASLNVKVGETVCWQWTDASDLHNVAEISAEGDQMKKEGGIYSGETAKTVDFRHTFTEATTFHYICEPHVGMQMVGEVLVGDVVTEEAMSTTSTEKEDTPGFGLVLGVLAVIGIALVSRRL